MSEHGANALDQKLGARVRARRASIGMSQARLADAIGVKLEALERYERGAQPINARALFDMSIALDEPLSVLAGETEAEAGRAGAVCAPPCEAVDVAGGAELLRLYASMPDETTRKRVLALVRAVSDGRTA